MFKLSVLVCYIQSEIPWLGNKTVHEYGDDQRSDTYQQMQYPVKMNCTAILITINFCYIKF